MPREKEKMYSRGGSSVDDNGATCILHNNNIVITLAIGCLGLLERWAVLVRP